MDNTAIRQRPDRFRFGTVDANSDIRRHNTGTKQCKLNFRGPTGDGGSEALG
jgi:hypothetical protein